MSLHRLSGGAGYQYLLRHTACGDADRAISDGLVDYYARTGYPPGQWLGGGLAGLSVDSPSPISPGDVVSEDQLRCSSVGAGTPSPASTWAWRRRLTPLGGCPGST